MGNHQHIFPRGNGALSEVIDFANPDDQAGPGDRYISEIRLHLSAAGGAVGNVYFTISIDSGEGVEFDAVISSTDMTALTDKDVQPGYLIRYSDRLVLTYANGSNRTWGVEVIYRAATEWD